MIGFLFEFFYIASQIVSDSTLFWFSAGFGSAMRRIELQDGSAVWLVSYRVVVVLAEQQSLCRFEQAAAERTRSLVAVRRCSRALRCLLCHCTDSRLLRPRLCSASAALLCSYRISAQRGPVTRPLRVRPFSRPVPSRSATRSQPDDSTRAQLSSSFASLRVVPTHARAINNDTSVPHFASLLHKSAFRFHVPTHCTHMATRVIAATRGMGVQFSSQFDSLRPVGKPSTWLGYPLTCDCSMIALADLEPSN